MWVKGAESCLESDPFVEVEKWSDDENDEAVQEDLKAFLLSLGIGANDIVTTGYDTLLYGKGKRGGGVEKRESVIVR